MTFAPRKNHRRHLVLVGVGALVAAFFVSRPDPVRADSAPVQRRAWAMGTHLTVTVTAVDRSTALIASESALRAVSAVEARLSTWNEDSELSRLNRAEPGAAVEISPELESDLRLARNWWNATGGAFDPGIASLVTAWDLRGIGREPSVLELSSARAAAGLDHLALGKGTASLGAAGFGIEEGAFGKGVALREATRAARAEGARCAIFEFGGQIQIEGECGERSIVVADPVQRNRAVARFALNTGSVATSGNSERAIAVDGTGYGHLLDPRTGDPAPDWGAVTVVASDPVAADCLSTALYVMGADEAAEWLRQRPGIEAVFVERDKETVRVTVTPGFRGRLEAIEGELKYLTARDEWTELHDTKTDARQLAADGERR